ncbi:NADPH:adrenodoxin oxidoreductase, mitochondrial-like [Acanthaster planci]|uniref:NADPH:adrenodoxin oxidoreductase, mitochondrial n=1 Tax=Acanthaster planci TaxID=133434 RepID=A0A8B7YDP6_ACAPL|nr:NADPH:adrenodoxin oxidoreductase, mitochondrial-like [Acanthaster planci]
MNWNSAFITVSLCGRLASQCFKIRYGLAYCCLRSCQRAPIGQRFASSGKPALRICIVGSGPAGFYTANGLLKGNTECKVDIYDKLPVPYGLVRYGVAPDHPEVKNVINQFSTLAENERCEYVGNVEVGKHISVTELLQAYDVVVLSYGAEADKCLNIPGEELTGVYSARSFVGWYNGLPQDTHLNPDLSGETAVVIGHGNVALDVARILITPTSILKKTDITQHALDALLKSSLKKVYIIGRRGPLQVAFTIKELREMSKLPGCRSELNPLDFEGLQEKLSDLPRARKRLTELMINTAQESPSMSADLSGKAWALKFLCSPVEILPCEKDSGRVGGIRLAVNKLKVVNGKEEAVPTGETEDIPCSLVLRSIGYKSLSLDASVPFDEHRGVIRHSEGRVTEVKGLYCSGWVKRGPTGVILSSLNDGRETAKTILRDLSDGSLDIRGDKQGWDQVAQVLIDRGTRPVSYADWLKIDAEEKARGEKKGKPREKLTSVEEMLHYAFR